MQLYFHREILKFLVRYLSSFSWSFFDNNYFVELFLMAISYIAL